MPQLGTADVTYTAVLSTQVASPGAPMKEQQLKMLFPNSTNVLYTSGGIPISNGAIGCPNALMKFIIADTGSSIGYVAKWDQSANTVRLWQQGNLVQGATGSTIAATTLVELTTAATVASTTLRIIAAGW